MASSSASLIVLAIAIEISSSFIILPFFIALHLHFVEHIISICAQILLAETDYIKQLKTIFKKASLEIDEIIPNRFQPREVFDEKALKEIGWIWTVEVWDDVTEPGNLLRKAKSRVAELAKGITSMELFFQCIQIPMLFR